MTATLQLTRTFGGITNRGTWQILVDGTAVDADDGQEVRFACHSQLLWPMYIASLINPELWISLRRAT